MALANLSLTPPFNGQLAGAKATLYTCPNGREATVAVHCTNTDAGTVSVNLYYKENGGTSRREIPMNMTLDSGSTLYSSKMSLRAGDEIEGDASVANVVDYALHGFERIAA